MSGKKVYDLAKEFGIQSKQFAEQLKEINIPVKNHMSVLSEQQEKYFRNNFIVEDGQIISRTPAEIKKIEEEIKSERKSREKKVDNRKKTTEKKSDDMTQKSGDRANTTVKRSRPTGSNQSAIHKDRSPSRNNQTRSSATASREKKVAESNDQADKQKKSNKTKNTNKSKTKDNRSNDNQPIRKLDNTKRTKGSKSSYKKKKLQEKEDKNLNEETIMVPVNITVAELAQKINTPATELIKLLMGYGVMAGMNHTIDFDTAFIICGDLGIDIQLEEEEDIIETILNKHYENPEKLKTRPPIITVMGHVDHGKTSLLDFIRNTNVISGEAGGITQHIGAYTINMHGKPITFIDTPGHEAFTSMRSRGASVTDMAILVIAADDGIKPQTIEAINHAKAAEVPIIVAINKIDKPEANPEKVKQELTEHGLVPEDWGGDTICVNVSAKTGEGVENLLDMILLVAEVEELTANFEEHAVGTVLEARVDKQRGVTASLLVKSGVLNEGDIIVTGTLYGNVRAMTNDLGKRIDHVGPSTAVELIGLNEVPEAGDKFFVVESEKEARKITENRQDRIKRLEMKLNAPVTLDELFNQISEGQLKEVKLVVKADVQGSLEALKQSLAKLDHNEDDIKVSVIHDGVGAVTETDVNLAAASNALIIAFNVRADNNARAASEKEGVEIRYYNVIYNVLEEIEDAMKGMLDPEFKEVITGTAEVRQLFRLPNSSVIAGSYVTSGTIHRKDQVRIIRDGVVIYDGVLSSLKRIKDDVKEVASGYECGIIIENYNDVKVDDILEFYIMEEIPRK